MSKRSAVLRFVIAVTFVISGQQAFGQAAPAAAPKAAFSELPVNPKYKPIPPDVVASNEEAATEEAKRARDRNLAYNNARKVLSNQIPADEAGKKILDEWFVSYFLPSFTLAENRGELPQLRHTLLNTDLRTAKQPAAITHLRTQVLRFMKGYAQNFGEYNFHPAVRHNAMLVIGDMNLVEYGARYPNNEKAYVPEPLPEALDLLISEYKSQTQIDAVRVAALVGLDRHAKLDWGRPAERRIPGTKKKVIVDEMIALLYAAPPATRSPEGHTWMQRRAIDILGALGMVGVYPAANTALESIVADKDAPISLRCTASETLAQWAPSNNKVDAAAVSKNLGLIAVKACKDELDRIATLQREEKEMKDLRELIKKPNPVASGQFGATTGASGGSDMGMMESYGSMGGYGADEGGMDGGSESMDEMYSGMGGGMMSGMYGGMLGGAAAAVPTDPRVIWSRRRLKYQLTCVKRGLEGMMVAGKASPQEKEVAKIKKAVEAALVFTDPPEEKPDLDGLTESIKKGLLELAFLAPQAAAAMPVNEPPAALDPAAPGAPTEADPAAAPSTAAPVVDPLGEPPTPLPGL